MVKMLIDSPMWASEGTVVNLAVARVLMYLNGQEYPLLITRLVNQVMRETSQGLIIGEDNDLATLAFARKVLADSDLTVIVGDAESDTFGQCQGDTAIYLNGSWVAQSQRVMEKLGRSHPQFEAQLAMMIIKIIHEHTHSMTAKIMKFEHTIRKGLAVCNPKIPVGMFDGTPLRIGYKNVPKGHPQLGDMGFAMEEILSGTGVRFNLDDSNCKRTNVEWDFNAVKLWQISGTEARLFQLRSPVNNTYLGKICTSSDPCISDFHVELQDLKTNTKRKPTAGSSSNSTRKKAKKSDSAFHIADADYSSEDSCSRQRDSTSGAGDSASAESSSTGSSDSDSGSDKNLISTRIPSEFSAELGFICPVPHSRLRKD